MIGCPKTIDGDLKNEQIETSFGFDTACKTYSELIGNIQRDCNSARKYWHFIKLMGRSASHIALECALETQPNACLVSEEVEQKAMSLDDVVTYLAKIVADRAADGNNFGTILVPEGLIEFIPAITTLIAELNEVLVAELLRHTVANLNEVVVNAVEEVGVLCHRCTESGVRLAAHLSVRIRHIFTKHAERKLFAAELVGQLGDEF